MWKLYLFVTIVIFIIYNKYTNYNTEDKISNIFITPQKDFDYDVIKKFESIVIINPDEKLYDLCAIMPLTYAFILNEASLQTVQISYRGGRHDWLSPNGAINYNNNVMNLFKFEPARGIKSIKALFFPLTINGNWINGRPCEDVKGSYYDLSIFSSLEEIYVWSYMSFITDGYINSVSDNIVHLLVNISSKETVVSEQRETKNLKKIDFAREPIIPEQTINLEKIDFVFKFNRPASVKFITLEQKDKIFALI
jgi:hypothetical protein